jgi:kojibiose phosphorylase
MTAPLGVIFDLDGVLVDTAEYHYQAWQAVADSIGVPFDRRANEKLRGVSREDSLLFLLGDRAGAFSAERRAQLCADKNAIYVRMIAGITPKDLLPGAGELLRALRAAGIPAAVASSSKNAREVLERLQVLDLLDALVHGGEVAKSKPDPALFLTAAARLGVPAAACVVVEDAEAGVAAALAGGMRAIGIGDPALVGAAHRVCASVAEVTVTLIRELCAEPVEV